MLPLSESQQYFMGPNKITITFLWIWKETRTAKQFRKCREREKIQPVWFEELLLYLQQLRLCDVGGGTDTEVSGATGDAGPTQTWPLMVGSGTEPVPGGGDSLVHEECWRPGRPEAKTRASVAASHFAQKLDCGLKSKTVRLLGRKKTQPTEDLQVQAHSSQA